jgi:hypothetical protein
MLARFGVRSGCGRAGLFCLHIFFYERDLWAFSCERDLIWFRLV